MACYAFPGNGNCQIKGLDKYSLSFNLQLTSNLTQLQPKSISTPNK